ncbi:MAG: DUF362 domain-containing protein [Candidatus Baldrarchaeota archaeon]
MSRVFFADIRSGFGYNLLDKLELLMNKLELEKKIDKRDVVGIKTHFGSLGTTRHLRPMYIRAIVDKVKELGGKPVVVETCGHGYGGGVWGIRATATGYLDVAARNGFTPQSLGANILILDGQWGLDFFTFEIKGNRLSKVYLPNGLRGIDFMIVASHFKGHDMAGFGGALKNLGVGLVAKPSKGLVHIDGEIKLEESGDAKCTGCARCAEVCPVKAITMVNGKPVIDFEKCIFCGFCYSRLICEPRVLRPKWTSSEEGTIRFVDNAFGVISYLGKDNFAYINFVIDVTPYCDCAPFSDQIIVPDQGILASFDPVAVDKASYDLVNQAPGIPGSAAEEKDATKPGVDKFSKIFGHNSAALQLEVAEKLGLGSREYALEWVIPEAQKEDMKKT